MFGSSPTGLPKAEPVSRNAVLVEAPLAANQDDEVPAALVDSKRQAETVNELLKSPIAAAEPTRRSLGGVRPHRCVVTVSKRTAGR